MSQRLEFVRYYEHCQSMTEAWFKDDPFRHIQFIGTLEPVFDFALAVR